MQPTLKGRIFIKRKKIHKNLSIKRADQVSRNKRATLFGSRSHTWNKLATEFNVMEY